jgi:hypothetical protein
VIRPPGYPASPRNTERSGTWKNRAATKLRDNLKILHWDKVIEAKEKFHWPRRMDAASVTLTGPTRVAARRLRCLEHEAASRIDVKALLKAPAAPTT